MKKVEFKIESVVLSAWRHLIFIPREKQFDINLYNNILSEKKNVKTTYHFKRKSRWW